jgi:hypothetical protein
VSKSVWILFGAATALAVSVASPASADTMICNSLTSCSYNLDDFVGTGTPPPGPYGTISLSQSGANVDVSVTLNSGNVFAVTGSGRDFLWDFHGDPTLNVQLTGSSVGEFTFLKNYSKPTVGAWDYGFECTGCGNGTSPPVISTLTFEIKNATLSEFIQNTSGYDFASDLGINCTGGPGKCYTGPVLGHPGNNQIPEPASLMLLGSGLVASGWLRRRKLKKPS